jgi:hypothetical protein
VNHGLQVFRGLSGIDFASTDVTENTLGKDPAGVTPTPTAGVAYDLVRPVTLQRLGRETEAG